jgi:hypothetical protein
MDNRKWERRVGGWGEGRQGEGKGIEKRAEIHKERRNRETKLTKKGEISNKLRRMSGSNGIQITNGIHMTTEGGGT